MRRTLIRVGLADILYRVAIRAYVRRAIGVATLAICAIIATSASAAPLPAPSTARVRPDQALTLECGRAPGYSFGLSINGRRLKLTRSRGALAAGLVEVFPNAHGATFVNAGARPLDVRFWCVA